MKLLVSILIPALLIISFPSRSEAKKRGKFSLIAGVATATVTLGALVMFNEKDSRGQKPVSNGTVVGVSLGSGAFVGAVTWASMTLRADSQGLFRISQKGMGIGIPRFTYSRMDKRAAMKVLTFSFH